jgi:hypothetical protein
MRDPYPEPNVETTAVADGSGVSYYVYGVVGAADASREAAGAADPGAPAFGSAAPRMIARTSGAIGVLARVVDARDGATVRELSLAHEEVVADLASRVVILPVAPGTTADPERLDDWLARSEELTRELLACVAGRVEVDVSARWSLHALARAGGGVADRDGDGGAVVARYLARHRVRDAERRAAVAMGAEVSRRVLAAVEAAAVVVQRAPSTAERLDVVCLVRASRLDVLDASLAAVERETDGLVSVVRGAPRAPYTVVARRLAPIGGARLAEHAS